MVMRAQTIAIGMAAATIIMAMPTEVANARCEIVACWTAECWWVGPHHRRCRRVCRHRCWHPPPPDDPPVYFPDPEPEPEPELEPDRVKPKPKSEPQPEHRPKIWAPSPPPIHVPFELIGTVLVSVGIFAFFRLIVHVYRVARMRRDIRIATRRAHTAQELQRRMTALAREADAFIDAARADVYRRGRDF